MNADCSGWTIVSIDYTLMNSFEKMQEKTLMMNNLLVFMVKNLNTKSLLHTLIS